MSTFMRRLTQVLLVVLLGCTLTRVVAVFWTLPRLIHDPLVYFPTMFYFGIGLSIVIAAYWTKSASRFVLFAPVVVIAIIIAADVRMPPSSLPNPTTRQAVRVLSFNIYQARLADDEIVKLIRERHSDVLCLQEVPPWFFRKHEKELRKMFRHVEFHNRLLVATEFDLVQVERLNLSYGRSLLHLELKLDGRRLDVFNTHLSVASPSSFFDRLTEQQEQIDQVLAHMARSSGPVLIAGDFNVPLHSTGYRRFAERYRSARSTAGAGFGYTFNTYLPITTIDHCFASEAVRFIEWKPLSVRLSDHRPVEVRLVMESTASTGLASTQR